MDSLCDIIIFTGETSSINQQFAHPWLKTAFEPWRRSLEIETLSASTQARCTRPSLKKLHQGSLSFSSRCTVCGSYHYVPPPDESVCDNYIHPTGLCSSECTRVFGLVLNPSSSCLISALHMPSETGSIPFKLRASFHFYSVHHPP